MEDSGFKLLQSLYKDATGMAGPYHCVGEVHPEFGPPCAYYKNGSGRIGPYYYIGEAHSAFNPPPGYFLSNDGGREPYYYIREAYNHLPMPVFHGDGSHDEVETEEDRLDHELHLIYELETRKTHSSPKT